MKSKKFNLIIADLSANILASIFLATILLPTSYAVIQAWGKEIFMITVGGFTLGWFGFCIWAILYSTFQKSFRKS